MPTANGPAVRVTTPPAISNRPAARVRRNPQRGRIAAVESVLSSAPKNCAVTRDPDRVSFSAHRDASVGSKGPSSTVTTPVGTNVACAMTIGVRAARSIFNWGEKTGIRYRAIHKDKRTARVSVFKMLELSRYSL